MWLSEEPEEEDGVRTLLAWVSLRTWPALRFPLADVGPTQATPYLIAQVRIADRTILVSIQKKCRTALPDLASAPGSSVGWSLTGALGRANKIWVRVLTVASWSDDARDLSPKSHVGHHVGVRMPTNGLWQRAPSPQAPRGLRRG